DAPLRAAAWTLEARGRTGGWTVVDRRGREDFAWARQLRPFRIERPGPWREYRLRFSQPRTVTLAEVELLQSSR
ncbi:MAG: alpha-1,2-mannosidase, partial [Luteimonas sp.]|nr:alpha-1,2-mannosidase [Luteimonas sp.]